MVLSPKLFGYMAVAALGSATAESSERCFPDNFLLGTATASYQVEGAWNQTGRTPSIWDDFCRSRPEVQCANVADDFVHRYVADIDIMKNLGLSSFRFSISWSRVMNWNNATKQMVPNKSGINFYHAMIDKLNSVNITPVLTLYHWDLPSELHTQANGWLNSSIVDHFNAYASLMYDEYGKKVPYWTTFNEPWTFTTAGYGEGKSAPGLGNSNTNVYLAAHNVLLAHGTAVKTFRQKKINGKIGIVLNSDMAFPLDPNSAEDQEAAERKLHFALGWYLNPIVNGDYPEVMKKRAGDHIPRFTLEQSALLRGSYDVFMLNHYSSNRVTDCASPRSKTPCNTLSKGWSGDLAIDQSQNPIGSRPASTNAKGESLCGWFNGYPWGYLPMIRWMHNFNKSAPILLTENGWCGNSTIDNQDQLWYYQGYLDQVWQGLQEGIPIIGYTAWSFVDNYEWGSFEPRFGLFHVNFPPQTGSKEGFTPLDTDLKLTPRPAATWFGSVAKSRCMKPFTDNTVVPDVPSSSPSKTGFYVGIVGLVLIGAVIVGVYIYQRRPQGTANEQTPLVAKD
ncbi:unnamed protein product [Aphanomyces euteiches]